MRVLAGSELKDLEPLLSDTKRETRVALELPDNEMKESVQNFSRKNTDKRLSHVRFRRRNLGGEIWEE